MSKKQTPYQFKSQLAYNQTTPAFLQRIKNQVAGRSGDDDEEDYDNWEPGTSSGSGHRRASPPRRPDDDPGSADEDDDDEMPQVVVLKEGKHLTALEAENEKRKRMSCHRPLLSHLHELTEALRRKGPPPFIAYGPRRYEGEGRCARR